MYYNRKDLPDPNTRQNIIIRSKRGNMKDWQQRVIIERAELDERIKKLAHFIKKWESGDLSENLSVEDLWLLRIQFSCMTQYLSVLDKRIENFKES